MNTRIKISPSEFQSNYFNLWLDKWFVLTCGNNKDFNSMTVSWGSMGVMWAKPFVQVVLRPQRHTLKFMEQYPTFTLCAFPEKYRESLTLLGSKSGKDSNKLNETEFTICPSSTVEAPSFNEAELVFECKKMYRQDMNPKNFLLDDIEKNYAKKDYHRIFFGEILSIYGTKEYSKI